jgi:hypothetical protein
MILGEKRKGAFQLGVPARKYEKTIRMAPKVTASEMMNSHIVNFFD